MARKLKEKGFQFLPQFCKHKPTFKYLKKEGAGTLKSSACIFAQLQPSRRILNSKQINHIEEA